MIANQIRIIVFLAIWSLPNFGSMTIESTNWFFFCNFIKLLSSEKGIIHSREKSFLKFRLFIILPSDNKLSFSMICLRPIPEPDKKTRRIADRKVNIFNGHTSSTTVKCILIVNYFEKIDESF